MSSSLYAYSVIIFLIKIVYIINNNMDPDIVFQHIKVGVSWKIPVRGAKAWNRKRELPHSVYILFCLILIETLWFVLPSSGLTFAPFNGTQECAQPGVVIWNCPFVWTIFMPCESTAMQLCEAALQHNHTNNNSANIAWCHRVKHASTPTLIIQLALYTDYGQSSWEFV